MDDKTFEEQKLRVKALLDKWLPPLLLAGWRIDYEWSRDSGPQRETQTGSAQWETCFKTTSQWCYKVALISGYLASVATLDDEFLEEAVIHECVHILINETRQPLDGDWADHEERVATELARAFVCVRNYAKEGTL